MNQASALLESLERLAERGIDPAAAVYERLFEQYPEFEPMFEMDKDGGVRGAMLQHTLECLIHHAEGSATGANFVTAERNTHDGYGIPPERFERFFEIVRDTLRDLLGGDWSEDTTTAWDAAIKGLQAAG